MATPELPRGFARAVLGALGHLPTHRPLSVPSGTPRRLPDGLGRANHVFQAGGVVLKVRADPSSTAAREAWALRSAPPGLAPPLFAHAPLSLLREVAAARRDGALLHALDARAGAVLCMGHVAGRLLEEPTDAQALEVGRTVAKLHVLRVAGPRLMTGSSPAALLAGLKQSARWVLDDGVLDERTVRDVRRALVHLEKHVRRGWSRWPDRPVRSLCHGDLRWHNIMANGDAITLLDLEHAGVGDPAVDLCLMAARTPLSRHHVLCVLDGYLEQRNDATLLQRMEVLEPLVVFRGAVDAVLDLSNIRQGLRRTTEPASRHLRERAPAARQEVQRALERALGSPPAAPWLALRPRPPKPRRRTWRITLDGTAMSGKSLLARALSAHLGAAHLNTGLLYRLAAWEALLRGLRAHRRADVERLCAWLAAKQPRLQPDGSLLLDGTDIHEALNVLPVERVVARWASQPMLRNVVGSLVRASIPARGSVVLEGRDAGTVLAPDADVKLLVVCGLAERAQRLVSRSGPRVNARTAAALLSARDHADRTRPVAPLQNAPGMHTVDTTRRTPEQATAHVLGLLKGAG